MVNKKNTNTSNSLKKKNPPKVNGDVGNYEKHPFFVKKVKKAKELLEKVGLPKALVNNSSN